MKLRLKKIFVIFVLLGYINLPFVSGQEADLEPLGAKKPVMYSVFWNTLWGSAWGGAMGLSYHLGSGISLRESLVSAATIGGVLGYGLGIYLVVSGLSFDKSFLLELPSPKFQLQPQNAAFLETEMMPLYTRSIKSDPTKWKVPIYAFRF
jgi:hypothetical protein